jgi:hypothetical protein
MSEDQMSQLAIRVQEIKSRKPVRYPEDLKGTSNINQVY